MFDTETELGWGFNIKDDGTADWAVGKIKEAQEEHDRLQALIDAKRAELDEAEAKNDKQLEQNTGFLKAKLMEYMRTVKCKDTKTQSTYQLLSGKLVRKKGRLNFQKDEEAMESWLLENAPDYVDFKSVIKWGDFKKTLLVTEDGTVASEDGEVLDFIKAEVGPEEFEVKF